MDVIELLNDLTGGQLLLWKVLLTSVIFACAGCRCCWQPASTRRRRCRPSPPDGRGPPPERQADRHPGRGGRPVLPGRAGRATSTDPVLLHSVFGSLVFGLLAAKYTALKLRPSWGRYLPWIGSSLFLTFAAIWATSVADYVTAR